MQKARITIPLAGGLATGQDGKTLSIGKSEELQNVRPGRLGEVVQRFGTRALSNTLLGSADPLPRSWALSTLRGDLCSFSVVGDHSANIYSSTANAWATSSTVNNNACAIKTKRRGPVLATLQQITGSGLFPDIAYSGGYFFAMYKATRNGVNVMVQTVVDATNWQVVGEYTWSGFNFIAYGVRVVNGYAVYVWATSTTINIDTWPVASIASGPTNRLTLVKTVNNALDRQFDILVKDSTTLSIAYSDGTNIQCVDYNPATNANTSWTPKDSGAANVPTDFAIAWMLDYGASGKIALIAHDPVNGLRLLWDIPTAGASRQAVTTYVLDAAAVPGTVTGFTMSNSSTGQFTVLYDENAVGPSSLIKAAVREAGVIGRSTYYRSLALGSKVFVGPDGDYYVGAEYISTTQPTRFVVRVPKTRTNFTTFTGVVAKTQVNNGYVGAALAGPLSPVVNPATNEYVFANTVQLRLPGNPTAYVPLGVGVDLVHVKFKTTVDTTTGAPREAIDSLFSPGGVVGQLDGKSYVDAGFQYYPEQPGIIPAGGGSLTAGATYYYRLVYSWIDANGRTWSSAPSAVIAQAMGANTKNTLGCPTYRLADRDDINIEVYRGAANDNVTFGLIGTIVNDPTVDAINFVDTFADASVAAGQALYTNGALGNRPLAADGIPGFSSICIAGGRAFGVSNDNPYEIWPSNKFIPGQGWRFSEQNKITINDNLGPVTGIAAEQSGTVVVFKSSAFYFISGEGPNQAGNGGSFSVSSPIVGVGTDNPRALLETPSGIEFRASAAPRAWFRVNNALQAEYIGSPIERYTNYPGTSTPLPIVGSVLIPSANETRYYTTTADNSLTKTLVHNMLTDTWTVDTSGDDLGLNYAACAYNSGAAVANSAAVYVDDPTSNVDGTGPYLVSTTTPWIKANDIDGFGMFIRARGVGEVTGSPAPTVYLILQADFDDATNLTIQSANPGPRWDWELKYPTKLSSFRFVIYYTPTNVSVKMSAIIVEYGIKDGMAPTPYTKRTQ